MIDFLFTVVSFVVALGVLIAVHEFGHFWVAKKMGVKVLRFSIGFGKPLWTRRGADETEYMVSAIPLGGYVKMLDEREGPVAEAELGRAFNRQPVRKRFAIVAAGPVFNLLFAVLAYWMMFVSGVPGIKPLVGEVIPGSLAAQAGVRAGQEVVEVDGVATPTWGSVFEALLPATLNKQPVSITVEQDGARYEHLLQLDEVPGEVQPEAIAQLIGLMPFRPAIEPVIGRIASGSPAERAGLLSGDRVLAINGQAVATWEEMVETVQARPGERLVFSLRRGSDQVTVDVRPERVETDSGLIGRIGAGVQVDPAQLEGLRAEVRYGPLQAVSQSVTRTWDMSVLTVQMLGRMVVGQASVDNISGPITIARYAKDSAAAGWAQFFSFLAIVSISLGILNLLPVPVLDGGHLLYFLIEAVKGSPVSEQVEMIGQRIGIALILMLMVLAFYNDLVRLAG